MLFCNHLPNLLQKLAFKSAVGNSPLLEQFSISDITLKFQPGFVVDSFDESSEMSAWLGQRYHRFDEISLLFEATQQSLGPRNVV
jgi:hypothetical protein